MIRLRFLRGAWLAGLLAWFGAAHAQTVELAPSAMLECVQPAAAARGAPEYPFEAWKLDHAGRVTVRLLFVSPTAPPDVAFEASEGGVAFVDAVRKHVEGWRLPCLAAGSLFQLRQEFKFQRADVPVTSAGPVDTAQARRAEILRCMTHTSGAMRPPFPERNQRAGEQGRVLARLRFEAPDRPPVAEVYARPSAAGLARVIEKWAQGYRLPCMEGEPIQSHITYIFLYEGEAYGFQPLSLPDLLAHVEGIADSGLVLDTNAVGCPFQIGFTYHQPFMSNPVSTRNE